MNRIRPLSGLRTPDGFLWSGNLQHWTRHVVFPLAVADQLIVDLSFAFQADTGIGGIVAAGVAIGGPDVLADHFSIEVQFVAVFVIDFCSVGCTGYRSPLPEYCASSLFITLINIFYMNTCHCRQ